MKRLYLLLSIITLFSLTSCDNDYEKKSLDEYIERINEYEFGFSNTGIDTPKYFLPSVSFFDDYEYIDGSYFYHDDSFFKSLSNNKTAEIAIVSIKYNENFYLDAKEEMLEKIQPYNNKFYEYGDYYFYENSNYFELSVSERNFPRHFTMACFNDENNVLIFIGFYSYLNFSSSIFEEKYINNFDENFTSFIDQYYGEYYDFSK